METTMRDQLEFHRCARGPAPTDVDCWHLVFDGSTKRLFVRHEWETIRHSGVDEFEVAEFLAQEGGAQTALRNHLFHEASYVASEAIAVPRPGQVDF
jgi:hypothetical protein